MNERATHTHSYKIENNYCQNKTIGVVVNSCSRVLWPNLSNLLYQGCTEDHFFLNH